jgi:hypothetical protein
MTFRAIRFAAAVAAFLATGAGAAAQPRSSQR